MEQDSRLVKRIVGVELETRFVKNRELAIEKDLDHEDCNALRKLDQNSEMCRIFSDG